MGNAVYLCPGFHRKTRQVDNVVVTNVWGDLTRASFASGIAWTVMIGVALLFAASDVPELSVFGVILLGSGIGLLGVYIWANEKMYVEYKALVDDIERGGIDPNERKLPWFAHIVNERVMMCDAMVLLSHRLTNAQTLLDATNLMMVKTYGRTSPLYRTVQVDRITLRARLSNRLEYDLRNGNMYLDGLISSSLNTSLAICDALIADRNPEASRSASLSYDTNGPTHVLSNDPLNDDVNALSDM